MHRRPSVIANEIRLKRSHHRGAFLALEGRDDRLFWEHVIDRAECRIVVAEGKQSVTEVIRILEDDGFGGIAGLVDADFDRLEGRRPLSANIGMSDLHDLECSLVRSSALDALLVEFGSREKLARFGRDVRDALLGAASPIGCLRLHSERAGIGLTFKHLTYSNCVDQDTMLVDRTALVQEVKNRSQRQDLPTEVLVGAVVAIEADGHDPWEVCSGADLIGILSLALRRLLGTNDARVIAEEPLRRALRLAYPGRGFADSMIREWLEEWQRRNAPFRVLG